MYVQMEYKEQVIRTINTQAKQIPEKSSEVHYRCICTWQCCSTIKPIVDEGQQRPTYRKRQGSAFKSTQRRLRQHPSSEKKLKQIKLSKQDTNQPFVFTRQIPLGVCWSVPIATCREPKSRSGWEVHYLCNGSLPTRAELQLRSPELQNCPGVWKEVQWGAWLAGWQRCKLEFLLRRLEFICRVHLILLFGCSKEQNGPWENAPLIILGLKAPCCTYFQFHCFPPHSHGW